MFGILVLCLGYLSYLSECGRDSSEAEGRLIGGVGAVAPTGGRRPTYGPTAAPGRGPGRNQTRKKTQNWENMKKGSKKEGSKTMLETTGAKF